MSSIDRFWAVQTGSPRSRSLWTTNSPQGQRSSSWNGVTQQRVADRLRAAQDRRLGIHHRREAAARDELVADRRPEAVRDALVDDLPRPLRAPVVVLLALRLGAQRRVALHERQAVRVVRADRERLGLGRVDGVGVAVDVEVQPRDQEVLVERRVRALVDERPVRRLPALREVRRDHDPRRAHLALDGAVLVQAPVHEVLVVRDGDVEREHQPARGGAPRRRPAGRRASTGPRRPPRGRRPRCGSRTARRGCRASPRRGRRSRRGSRSPAPARWS